MTGLSPVHVVSAIWASPTLVLTPQRAYLMLSKTSLEKYVRFGASVVTNEATTIADNV